MPRLISAFKPILPTYLGLDPGVSGGLTAIQGSTVIATSMPDTEDDIWRWFSSLDLLLGSKAVLEQVSASPQMGVTSAFTFGGGYHRLRAFLTVLAAQKGLQRHYVRPQVWQKALGIPPRKKGKQAESQSQWKGRLRAKAMQLFPDLAIWNEPKSKGRQLDIADSLLIAYFCQQTYGGNHV